MASRWTADEQHYSREVTARREQCEEYSAFHDWYW
jgi:hypothetical protein